MFVFNLNTDITLSIPLQIGMSFAFSGQFLTHRQHGPVQSDDLDKNPFFNVASHGNQKLFSHLRCSFKRNINELNENIAS